jgi:hypothetical protein
MLYHTHLTAVPKGITKPIYQPWINGSVFLSLKIAIINKSVLPAKMKNVLPQQHQSYKEFKVIKT